MARITKFELEQLLAAAQSEVLALRTRVSQLTADVALRDARIERGLSLVNELRREVVALKAAPPKVIVRKMVPAGEPIVTRFTRGGKLWEKTRVGSRSTERVVDDERDLAHEADMRELAREQLRGEDFDDEDSEDDYLNDME